MDVPCGHGCCGKCSRYPSSRAATPDTPSADVHKEKPSRKGHGSKRPNGYRRRSAQDFGGSVSAVVENEEPAATGSSVAHTTRGSCKSSCDITVDCQSKKTKGSSSGKKKGHKQRN
ncbi:hypothetical protein GGR55DRAFT_675984 [Xylaria sp. FL0064]|nr:hypothetical protein GGR55DRAFT_675984 [Xylaria sp. FL0064]